ncbi:MAG: hypothetical protein WC678_00520 [Parcubacteria group bacterium]|jgi:hypothetical protein
MFGYYEKNKGVIFVWMWIILFLAIVAVLVLYGMTFFPDEN